MVTEDLSPYAANADRPVPGMAKLKRQVSRLRAALVVVLVLLIVVGVWAVIGVTSLSSTVSSLETKVEKLQSETSAQAAGGGGGNAASGGGNAAQQQSIAAATSLPDGTPMPVGVDGAGAILVGDPNASNVVEVFIDYQCPFCQQWEAQVGAPLMAKALQPGSNLLVKQYNLAFLKEANRELDPHGASARAANAAACVIDGGSAEVFVAFDSALFASADPSEPPSQFQADALSALASQAGAGAETITCIEDLRYVPFASAVTKAAFARGVTGTPTVLVNGRLVESSFSDQELLALAQG